MCFGTHFVSFFSTFSDVQTFSSPEEEHESQNEETPSSSSSLSLDRQLQLMSGGYDLHVYSFKA